MAAAVAVHVAIVQGPAELAAVAVQDISQNKVLRVQQTTEEAEAA